MKNILTSLRVKLKKRKYDKFKSIQLEEKDCGPASLSMIFKYYGKNISISNIAQIAKTDFFGTTGKGMITSAKYYGFNTLGKKIKHIYDINNEMLPCICCTNGKSQLHYVVLFEIYKNIIIYGNPSSGIESMNIDEFDQEKFSNIILLLEPTKIFFDLNIDRNNYLLPIIKKCHVKFILIIICSILLSLLGITQSIYYKNIIDIVIPNKAYNYLNKITFFTVLLIISKGVIDILRQYFVLVLSKNIDNELMNIVYKKILYLPFSFYSTKKTGDIISRLEDVSIIRDAIAQIILTIFLDSLLAFVGIIMLSRVNKIMFLISIIPIIFYSILLYYLKNNLKKYNMELLKLKSKVKSSELELINGYEKIKAFNKQDSFFKSISNLFYSYTLKGSKYGNVISIQLTIQEQINLLFNIIILFVGANFILEGTISIGELILFNSLLYYFINPCVNLISLCPKIITAKTSKQRLDDLLDLTEENLAGKIDHIDSGDIEFNNVTFSYNNRNNILKDISFKINSSTKIGIIGNSGSGKTTILNLLLAYYKPDKGTIYLNNNDLNNYSKSTIRNNIVCISQNCFLFNKTIFENFKLANETICEKEILSLCHKVKLDYLIEKLPFGLNSMIYENSSNFSSGEKQKLSIAIALARKPKILLLDEATSNLDATSESIIQNIINSIDNITIIIVSHRLTLTRNCEKILAINDGVIEETGTHQELIQNKGFYYNLWNTQMKGKQENYE